MNSNPYWVSNIDDEDNLDFPEWQCPMQLEQQAGGYTESQILHGLREVWPNLTGNDDPFHAETSIPEYLRADGTWEEIDLADIFRGVETFFDFQSPDSEWTALFGFDIAARSLEEWERSVAPKLTFGLLARFVANRAPVIATFRPLRVFGRECAPAGVFVSVRNVANKLSDKQLRFPPSARIIDVLRGHELDRFWTQLRWMTEHGVPSLPDNWRGITEATGVLSLIGVVFSLLLAWITGDLTPIFAMTVSAGLAYLAASLYKQRTNPLPPHIETFRDLSLLIANRKPRQA